MNSQGRVLPSFATPPVTEVVLSVQFEALSGFGVQHYGPVFDLFRQSFSRIETQPPLAPIFEAFGEAVAPPGIRFEVTPQYELPRVWFLNGDGSQLIQVQRDRFIHNWRKVDAKLSYPRYETLRTQFEREIECFAAWAEREGLGAIRANQCEVSYVNQISPPAGPKDMGRVVKMVNPPESVCSGSFIESFNFASRYILRSKGSQQPQGRLHIEAVPAFTKRGLAPVFLMNLTVRGAPTSSALSDVLDFFDFGREAIVNSFAAITTEEMHQIWGREDGS